MDEHSGVVGELACPIKKQDGLSFLRSRTHVIMTLHRTVANRRLQPGELLGGWTVRCDYHCTCVPKLSASKLNLSPID